jgi:GT2 family glycosyltransferase
MAPKVSVVLPCYNGEKTIRVQLSALSRQQLTEQWEVIFVDNRSTDNSIIIAKEFFALLPCLRIIQAGDRQGQPYALNAGVEAAKGKKILLCDADDEVGEGWLSEMSSALSKYNIIAARLDINRLNTPEVRKMRGNPVQRNGLISYDYPPYFPHAAGASLGFKRSLYYAVEGFDERFPALHDTDFCWKAQILGEKIHFVEDAIVHYRYRPTIRGNYKQAKYYGEYNVKLYKKYQKLGIPQIKWKDGLKNWKRLFGYRQLLNLRYPSQHAFYFWQFGWQLGRLKGCIKYKVLAL